MVNRYKNTLRSWFLINFAAAAILVGVSSCAPRSYFLVNSDLAVKYNRTTGEWYLVWKSAAKHVKSDPDTIPVEPVKVSGSIPVELSPDSVKVSE